MSKPIEYTVLCVTVGCKSKAEIRNFRCRHHSIIYYAPVFGWSLLYET